MIVLLENHQGSPIGEILEMKSDEKGIEVLFTTKFFTSEILSKGKYLSLGFKPIKSNKLINGQRELQEIEIFEVSVVDNPAQYGTEIYQVTNIDESTISESKK